MPNRSEAPISSILKPIQRSSRLPKVAICIPSSEYWEADFGVALALLVAQARTVTSQLAVINRKGSRVAEGRNKLVHAARQNQADYLLFLDSDMVFPADTLSRLLLRDKDIVGGTYVKRVAPHTVLGVPLPGAPKEYKGGCVRVAGIPTGCMLVAMSVFDKLPEPWFMEPPIEIEGRKELMGEDYFFCSTAGNVGLEVWLDVDLSYELLHIGRAAYQVPPVKAEADYAA